MYKRQLLRSGVVMGADGFGFAPNAGSWEKIEQLGAVVIGNDVEIGANTCVDRGALDDTTIEDGVKLDNLIQIGHNVRAVSYTHLRAHATVLDIVCRLLLVKKTKNNTTHNTTNADSPNEDSC